MGLALGGRYRLIVDGPKLAGMGELWGHHTQCLCFHSKSFVELCSMGHLLPQGWGQVVSMRPRGLAIKELIKKPNMDQITT